MRLHSPARRACVLWIMMLVFVAGMAAYAVAQPGNPASGDFIAGQASPWRNAHFVLLAYGAVWVGLALYVWRLANLARRLDGEVKALEQRTRSTEKEKTQGHPRE